jgi:4-hydroxybenzoate polyprenyltransferase
VKELEKALLVVKLSRPRTWTFAIVSYLFGYMATGTPILWQIFLGGAIFALGTAATNLLNVYTDIEEDAINLPLRTEMMNELGRRKLLYVAVGLYPLILLLSVPFGSLFILVVTLAELDSIGYSLPPLRFKRHPVTALLSFSGAVSLPFLAGLVIAGASLLNPLLIFLGSFMFAYGTVKNIPDILGDIRAGLKTTATASSSLKKAVKTSALFLLIPYVVLFSMVALRILGPGYLMNSVFLPFLAYWALQNSGASNLEMLEQLHSFGFIYAVSFILFNLVLTYPSQLSVGIFVVTLSFILVVTKFGMDSRLQNTIRSHNLQSLKQEDEKLGYYRHRGT